VKRWRSSQWKDGKQIEKGRQIERPDIDAFLDDIVAVCRKHGFGISHEDSQGGFIVVDGDAFNEDWLRAAADDTEEVPA
jgi:hypothetical protein